VELAETLSVELFVQVLDAVIPEVERVPPFSTICEAKVALVDGFKVNVPAVIVVAPVYVCDPEKVKVFIKTVKNYEI
jgi:hypothetical protein